MSLQDLYSPGEQHRFNVLTQEGLLALVTLADILELSMFLDERFNSQQPDFNRDLAEWDYIRAAYSQFQDIFCKNQCLFVEDQLLDPKQHLFHPSVKIYALHL